MKKMAIVEWGAPLAFVETNTPVPAGKEILVQTEVCGVCHSDVHVWDGYFDFGVKGRMRFADRGAKLPFTLGHEIVGVVVAKGPEASGVEVGRSYIVYPWIGCGQCVACLRGDELACGQSRSLGLRCDGGYADHVLVPDARYLVSYDGLAAELACTFACSGITAWSALKKAAPIAVSEWLCVIGAGGVGGAALQMAISLLKAKVIVVDIDPRKLRAAEEAGAHAIVDGRAPDAVQKIVSISGGGPAAIVDFVGSGDTFTMAIDASRRGGKIVLVGLFGGSATISPLSIATKLLTVQASYVGTLDELKEIVGLAQAGRLTSIPTFARPLEEATQALEELRAGAPRPGRSILRFARGPDATESDG